MGLGLGNVYFANIGAFFRANPMTVLFSGVISRCYMWFWCSVNTVQLGAVASEWCLVRANHACIVMHV